MWSRLLLCISGFLLIGCQNCRHIVPDTSSRALYLMIGDSQMIGQGELQSEPTDPHVTMFDWDNKWQVASEPTSDAVSTRGAMSFGFSCGVSFGKTMRGLLHGANVGIIPCGHNGSTVIRWLTDGVNSGENMMYSLCIDRTREAIRTSGGHLAGIIIHLGSNDGMRVFDASGDSYASNFVELMSKFRKDLSGVPIAFAKIGQTTRTDAIDWELIRSQQDSIRIPFSTMILTDDLTLKSDGIHLDASGERELGQRLAVALKESDSTLTECSDPWWARLVR